MILSAAQGSRLMALGVFVFELKTLPFDGLSRQTAWRWPGKERAGGPPAHQYAGPGDDTLTIDGVLMPELTGGGKELEALRKMAAEGKAWILLSGDGRELGQYFIERVEDKGSHFLSNGAPRKIEFTIALKRYWEDEGVKAGGLGGGMLGDLKASLPDVGGSLQSAAAVAVGDLAGQIGDGVKEAVGRLGGALESVTGASATDVAGAFSKASAAARMLPGLVTGDAAAKLTRFAAAAGGLESGDIAAVAGLLRDTPAARSVYAVAGRLDSLAGGMAGISQAGQFPAASDALGALGRHVAELLPLPPDPGDEGYYDP